METQPYFADIWGTKETRCSALIAQSIILSNRFREFIANRIAVPSENFSIDKIQTEYVLSGEERIDIYIACSGGLIVGIENKKWASFQEYQLKRYTDALKERSSTYKLIFLAPSRYHLSKDHTPHELVRINYQDIYRWIKEQSFETSFEENYFYQLLMYLDELEVEMKPLNFQEINSLLHHNSALDKLRKILIDIKGDSKGIENPSSSGYTLYGIFDYGVPIYIGFRYSTNWYYSDNLLNNGPECLIYVKDLWDEAEQVEKNQFVNTIHSYLKDKVTDQTTVVRYYTRKTKNECRLSIRKSLFDFDGKEQDEISKWFNEHLELLKQAILVSKTT